MVTDESGNINAKPAASGRRGAAKRRFVRKGTKSCWECRRRKIRCMFNDNGPHDTCRTCWQKGVPCVSQEFPEEYARKAPAPVGSLGDRLSRVERLVDQLYHRMDEIDTPMPKSPQTNYQGSCSPGPEAPVASCSPGHAGGSPDRADRHTTRSPSPVHSSGASATLTGDQASQKQPPAHTLRPDVFLNNGTSAISRFSGDTQLLAYSRQLSAAIPSTEDCQAIYEVYSEADLVFQLMFLPHCLLETRKPESVKHCVESLGEPTHPVLLAKKMLLLAAMLQRAPARRISEPALPGLPFRIMEGLADAAMNVVCENNALMGTIDALECIILQTMYLANSGKPRLSLLSCRRAISLAQLMGLHRPHDPAAIETMDPDFPAVAGFIWFRLVYIERFICLLLGLPSSTNDAQAISDETTRSYVDSHPLGRLERVHCEVAAKIIQRNEQDSNLFKTNTVYSLDHELQEVAASMPPRWWTIPVFVRQPDERLELMWHSLRLCNQIFHFFLIIEIHLPFMLRHSKEGAASSSRIACVDASRELLARFISIRNTQGAWSIPDSTDFFALIAAMTLLLAHIDARKRDRRKDVLAHQRHTDRDKVEETLEHMRDGSSKSADMLSMKSADVLKSLLAIEADAAKGSTFTASLSSTSTPASSGVGEGRAGNARNVMQLKIPCYGTVTISPDAPPSREPWTPSGRAQQWVSPEARTPVNKGSADPDVLTGPAAGEVAAAGMAGSTGPTNQEPSLQLGHNADPRLLFELGNPWLMAPGISTGPEDWHLQGVDAAFFESMIRGFEGADPSF